MNSVKEYLGSLYKNGDEKIEPIREAAEKYMSERPAPGLFGFLSKKKHPFEIVSIPVKREDGEWFYTSFQNPAAKIPLNPGQQKRVVEILGAYTVGTTKGGSRRTRRRRGSRTRRRRKL